MKFHEARRRAEETAKETGQDCAVIAIGGDWRNCAVVEGRGYNKACDALGAELWALFSGSDDGAEMHPVEDFA